MIFLILIKRKKKMNFLMYLQSMRECFREFYNASLFVGLTLLLLFVGYDVLFFPVDAALRSFQGFGQSGCDWRGVYVCCG